VSGGRRAGPARIAQCRFVSSAPSFTVPGGSTSLGTTVTPLASTPSSCCDGGTSRCGDHSRHRSASTIGDGDRPAAPEQRGRPRVASNGAMEGISVTPSSPPPQPPGTDRRPANSPLPIRSQRAVDLARSDAALKVPTGGSRRAPPPGGRVLGRSLCAGPGVRFAGYERVQLRAGVDIIGRVSTAMEPAFSGYADGWIMWLRAVVTLLMGSASPERSG
jgi:hypothetical protein